MRFRSEKRENQKLFEFGAFQKNMHMPSREKYIFHTLFGAFKTPHSILLPVVDFICAWSFSDFLLFTKNNPHLMTHKNFVIRHACINGLVQESGG